MFRFPHKASGSFIFNITGKNLVPFSSIKISSSVLWSTGVVFYLIETRKIVKIEEERKVISKYFNLLFEV